MSAQRSISGGKTSTTGSMARTITINARSRIRSHHGPRDGNRWRLSRKIGSRSRHEPRDVLCRRRASAIRSVAAATKSIVRLQPPRPRYAPPIVPSRGGSHNLVAHLAGRVRVHICSQVGDPSEPSPGVGSDGSVLENRNRD
jgi:hypothetical protein